MGRLPLAVLLVELDLKRTETKPGPHRPGFFVLSNAAQTRAPTQDEKQKKREGTRFFLRQSKYREVFTS